jgi:ParB-like chromosome segregation protein Spo0J
MGREPKKPVVRCAYDAMVPIGDLRPNPKNPNRHPDTQIDLLAHIIDAQGWRAGITVSNLSGYIVRGHGRLLAAQYLGLDEAPVDYQDYDSPEQEMADLIADNRLSELADTDNELLTELLTEIKDVDKYTFDLTGYTAEDHQRIMCALVGVQAADDDFDPAPQGKPKTKAHEVWILGRHRLMCGDSSVADDMKTLMGGGSR